MEGKLQIVADAVLPGPRPPSTLTLPTAPSSKKAGLLLYCQAARRCRSGLPHAWQHLPAAQVFFTGLLDVTFSRLLHLLFRCRLLRTRAALRN